LVANYDDLKSIEKVVTTNFVAFLTQTEITKKMASSLFRTAGHREGIMKRILVSLVVFLGGCCAAIANNCPSYPYTLTNGTTADANQVMGNFNTIMNCASFYVGGTTTGSAGAQTLASVSPGVFTLTSGNRVTFITGFSTTGATTLNVALTGAVNVLKKTAFGLVPLVANDMAVNQVYTVQYDGTQYELLDPIAGGASPGSTIVAPQGRLTLQSHTPVMTTSQNNVSTVYYDCYAGNSVPYFSGLADALDTITNCEVTLPLSTTWVGQGSVFDIWWVHGSGANPICVAVGSGGGWAQDTGGSNTSRGTGYTQLDNVSRPYITNKNAISNCFNALTNYGPISPNQATYLGTMATNSGANALVSYTFGSVAAGGGAARFGLWNAYNRVTTATTVQDNSSWTTTSTSWQPYDVGGSGGGANNRVTYVVGLTEDGITAMGRTLATNGTSGQAGYGIGIDSFTASSGGGGYGTNGSSTNNALVANYAGIPGIGLHYVQELQITQGGTSSFYGAAASDSNALTVSLRN
jgi:hypothetical protein